MNLNNESKLTSQASRTHAHLIRKATSINFVLSVFNYNAEKIPFYQSSYEQHRLCYTKAYLIDMNILKRRLNSKNNKIEADNVNFVPLSFLLYITKLNMHSTYFLTRFNKLKYIFYIFSYT